MNILSVAAALLAAAPPGAAEPGLRLISMQTARARAQAIVPGGRIRTAGLEREQGRLIYSFDIQRPDRPGVEEIRIDAADGRLVTRRHESPAAGRRGRRGHR